MKKELIGERREMEGGNQGEEKELWKRKLKK